MVLFFPYILHLLCCFGEALAEEGQSQQSDRYTKLFSVLFLTDQISLLVCEDKKRDRSDFYVLS